MPEKRSKRKPKRPVIRKTVERPSVHESRAEPTKYNEQPGKVPWDIMPKGNVGPGKRRSKAQLRMQVEVLLQRREPPGDEAWAVHGPSTHHMLVEMLDDLTVARRPALRQRIIATLGQLKVKVAIPRLGEILAQKSEDDLTRTFAASALGHMGDATVVPILGRAALDKSEVVRRQVAYALRRTANADAVPHLLILSEDPAKHVGEVARAGLQAFEKELGKRLIKGRKQAVRKKRRVTVPARDH